MSGFDDGGELLDSFLGSSGPDSDRFQGEVYNIVPVTRNGRVGGPCDTGQPKDHHQTGCACCNTPFQAQCQSSTRCKPGAGDGGLPGLCRGGCFSGVMLEEFSRGCGVIKAAQ